MEVTDSSGDELASGFETNVFVMMRFRDEKVFSKIAKAIRDSVAKYGLRAWLASDHEFYSDLWTNIVHYMKHCKYGIAVFEEISEREFNPNIALELGYMYALGRIGKCWVGPRQLLEMLK